MLEVIVALALVVAVVGVGLVILLSPTEDPLTDYNDSFFDDDGKEYAVVEFSWGDVLLTEFYGGRRACCEECRRLSKEARRYRSGRLFGVREIAGAKQEGGE